MEKKAIGTSPDLILIGGSAGSIDAIIDLLPLFPADFKIPIVLVLHRLFSSDNRLTSVFQAKSKLPVYEAEEKHLLRQGFVYLAPANYHLLIESDCSFSLDDSEKINFSRPSIDVTFEQASEVYKEKLVAILLTGANTDGAKGMLKIQENGGLTIVQNPDTAEVDAMPKAALALSNKHQILNLNQIVPFLLDLISKEKKQYN